ncbi:hydroxyisourate hydrolase [Leptolyngbya sp. PCC 6406]|uniref:hydroxyisourate hydrolase n=1 Tax=Leptolyngbya sp. PCC 6406 TaxID=1173264 RepID=UPI0002ABF4A8|nr:hydroxyisourate hydrolase [Leptolyngbya sp. PCC 6406]
MTGKLTTHVLDTAQGHPAAYMALELWYLAPAGDVKSLMTTTRTNADGRTDAPLLEGEDFILGVYELLFDVQSYFATQPLDLPDPPFLGWVPLRFTIADVTAHYHVPLLVSPWSYSTYRGS